MPHTVYILYSSSASKYYTGSTQDLDNRLREHNSGETALAVIAGELELRSAEYPPSRPTISCSKHVVN
jgi:predicted GIY-YIG superfamily endonuclease